MLYGFVGSVYNDLYWRQIREILEQMTPQDTDHGRNATGVCAALSPTPEADPHLIVFRERCVGEDLPAPPQWRQIAHPHAVLVTVQSLPQNRAGLDTSLIYP